MEQGNSNKVNAIVEEIVKGNEIFKLKSPIEQDKEKDSMVRSINSALSVLNEVGRKLVLQDLSVDPDEKFKGFIDSVGNIDISGITRMTATIVTAKIEEAEREGIDLRKDAPIVFKETKNLVTEGVLTIAVIDTMVKNFKDLSYTDKKELFDNWNLLTSSQKTEILKAESEHLAELASQEKSPEKKELLEDSAEILGDVAKKLQEATTLSEEQLARRIDIFLIHNPNFKTYVDDLYNEGKSTREIYTRLIEQKGKILGEEFLQAEQPINSERNPKYKTLVESEKSKMKDEEFLENASMQEHFGLTYSETKQLSQEERLAMRSTYLFRTTPEILQYYNITQEEAQQISIEKCREMFNKYNIAQKHERKLTLDEKILQEIQQIPIALATASFSPKHIKEALIQYKNYFENASSDDIEFLSEQTSEDRADILKEEFENFELDEQTTEILRMMSGLTFNGKMKEILTYQEMRLKFLKQFDEVIEQGFNDKQPIQLSGELAQVFSKYFEKNSVEMIVVTEQERTTQESQETEQENYSFINAKYLEQDSMEGLIPRNGGNSKAIQDDKTAIFYSQGKEGAIVMYFEFLRQYENLRGARGDEALQKYEAYQNGSLQLTEEQLAQLEAQIEQIKDVRDSQSFDEFMGDKLYLKIEGLDREEDKKKADEWRAAHPGTKMNYNYANSWTEETIPPDRIDVVTLQRNDGTDTRVSQKDIITYFLGQTSIEKIAELGINDTTLGLIQAYYEEHSSEIAEFGTQYSLVNQNIKEFAQSRENKVQAYGVTGRTENEGQEEYEEGAAVQGVQEFLKLTRDSRTTVKDVSEQRTTLREQIKGQEINPEISDEDLTQ